MRHTLINFDEFDEVFKSIIKIRCSVLSASNKCTMSSYRGFGTLKATKAFFSKMKAFT